MNKQQGFTLIELVMVIVILGILAATALPKFTNLQADAKKAAMEGATGALKSAHAMVHAKALIAGISNNGQNLVVDGMGTIRMANQYPTNTSANFTAMLDLSSDFTLANGRITHAKAATATKCRISISNATITGTVITPPAITTDFTDC